MFTSKIAGFSAALCCLLLVHLSDPINAQTFDLNVTCPVVNGKWTPSPTIYPSAIYGNPFWDDCGCTDGSSTSGAIVQSPNEPMLAKQNEYLQKQFAQLYLEHEKIMTELKDQRAHVDGSIADLKKSIRQWTSANQKSVESLAKQSRSRDQKMLKQIQATGSTASELSEELISVAEKTVANTRSIIEVIQESDERLAKFQKQMRNSIKNLNRKVSSNDKLTEELEEHHEETEEMFEALEEDLEEIRDRISGFERAESKRQKEMLRRLQLLNEIEARLEQSTAKKKPRKKKKK